MEYRYQYKVLQQLWACLLAAMDNCVSSRPHEHDTPNKQAQDPTEDDN